MEETAEMGAAGRSRVWIPVARLASRPSRANRGTVHAMHIEREDRWCLTLQGTVAYGAAGSLTCGSGSTHQRHCTTEEEPLPRKGSAFGSTLQIFNSGAALDSPHPPTPTKMETRDPNTVGAAAGFVWLRKAAMGRELFFLRPAEPRKYRGDK